MQYRAHRFGGMCAGAISSAAIYGTSYLNFLSSGLNNNAVLGTVILVAAGAAGSLTPDIDHPNSRVSKDNRILSFIVNLFLGLSRGITNLLLALCFWIPARRKNEILSGMGHRGIFHTLAMVVAIYFLFGFVANFIPLYGRLIQIGFTAGYLSHLLIDMLTKGGVMLLYPFITHKFHWPVIRLTTGKHEAIAVAITLMTTIAAIAIILR